LAANLAATWSDEGLPRPKAVMCAHPGVMEETEGGKMWQMTKKDYTRIDPSTLMLGIAGADDDVVGSYYGNAILQEAPIPDNQKDLSTVRGAPQGGPPLMADHGAPTATVGAGNAPNAIDWYGYWKWGDALLYAAFSGGKGAHYALGDTAQQRFMGRWSDGVAV